MRLVPKLGRTIETGRHIRLSLRRVDARWSIYLHFLNPQLSRALGTRFWPAECVDYLRLAAVLSRGPLYASLAFIWESRILERDGGRVTRDLLASNQLLLVSEFRRVDDFVASCQAIYAHDRERYPMYFDAVLGDLRIMHPRIHKADNTTLHIAASLDAVTHDRPSAVTGLSGTDADAIFLERNAIATVMRQRESEALTLTLFENVLGSGRDGSLALGRFLSLLHLQHYLKATQGDIMTGVRGREYFDRMALSYPYLDARYGVKVLDEIGLGTIQRRRLWSELLTSRGSSDHVRFLESYAALVDGFHFVASHLESGAELNTAMRPPVISFEEFGIRGFSAVRPGDASSIYHLASERLAQMQLQATRRSGLLTSYMSLRREVAAVETSRVLLLVATEVERDSFIAEVKAQTGLEHLHREYLAYHTLFHLGIVGGAEVLLAQSEPGTESPGAMTLTAADVADQCLPDYMIVVGIGYGLKEDEQRLGDLMISTDLKLVGPRKVTDVAATESWPVSEIQRGARVPASVTLLDRFRSADVDWSGTRRHYGLMLSQHVLVNSKRYVDRLRSIEPDAIGGEMEGAGAYCVGAKRKIDWIVVKSISDWGYNKNDEMQATAAANTASYVTHVLAAGGLARPPRR